VHRSPLPFYLLLVLVACAYCECAHFEHVIEIFTFKTWLKYFAVSSLRCLPQKDTFSPFTILPAHSLSIILSPLHVLHFPFPIFHFPCPIPHFECNEMYSILRQWCPKDRWPAAAFYYYYFYVLLFHLSGTLFAGQRCPFTSRLRPFQSTANGQVLTRFK